MRNGVKKIAKNCRKCWVFFRNNFSIMTIHSNTFKRKFQGLTMCATFDITPIVQFVADLGKDYAV